MQLGDEALLVLAREAHAEVGEPPRQRLDVLVGGVDEEPCQLGEVAVAELAGEAEVDEADSLGREHQDVRRVRVAVEEAVAEDHRQPGLGDHVGEPVALLHRPDLEVEIGELDAGEVLEREHALARVAPVGARHRHVRVAGEVAMEGLGVAALLAVVELLADRARELVDELARVDEVERAHAFAHEPRGLLEQLDVALDLARRVGPLHLDDDLAPVRKHRPVYLPDRGRRERLAVELEEEALDRLAQVLADHPLDVGEGEGADVVLERAQLGDDVRRDDVGSGREQLAELDEGRAELVEQLAQVTPAGGRGARVGAAAPLIDEEAEAVAHGDLRDLAEPPEVAPSGARGHLRSVARPGAAVARPRRSRLLLANRADRGQPGAAGGVHLDGLARPASEQRRAERRGRRDGARAAERAQLDRHHLALLVGHLDDRADPDLLARALLDDAREVEARAQRTDARLEQPLLVLGGVVLEVLGEVAELARLLDRGDDLLAARALELGELEPQRLGLTMR